MRYSDWSWKIASEVKKWVRYLNLKKDSGLKYNIKIQYKGLGRLEDKTTQYNNRKKKTIPQLQDRLIEIIKLTKKWHVPDEPSTKAPQRIEISIVGTLSSSVKELYWKTNSKEKVFKNDAREEWQLWEEIGETTILDKMQQLGKRNIYDSFIGISIEYLSEFDLVGE